MSATWADEVRSPRGMVGLFVVVIFLLMFVLFGLNDIRHNQIPTNGQVSCVTADNGLMTCELVTQ